MAPWPRGQVKEDDGEEWGDEGVGGEGGGGGNIKNRKVIWVSITLYSFIHRYLKIV